MSPALRPDVDQLIHSYRSYAHAIAAEILYKLPSHIDKGDIVGSAELGLVQAAQSFDASRGVLFKTFAYYRIRGAIYDGLRKMAWFSKAQYEQYRFERAANEYLSDYSMTAVPQGTPEEEGEELKNIAGSLVSCYMLSLDQFPQQIGTPENMRGEDESQKMEQQEVLRQCLSQLPERNRQVMEFYYLQDLSMEQIGEKLGLSKSWVCRIHSKSLEMLRTALQVNFGREAPATP
jgi:RNA polymerase sigma factor for flagellar operon FliA